MLERQLKSSFLCSELNWENYKDIQQLCFSYQKLCFAIYAQFAYQITLTDLANVYSFAAGAVIL